MLRNRIKCFALFSTVDTLRWYSIHHLQAAAQSCNPLEVHFTHEQLSIQSISIYHNFTHTTTDTNTDTVSGTVQDFDRTVILKSFRCVVSRQYAFLSGDRLGRVTLR